VYFTVRRILYQLGGIQSISVLPGDLTFNKSDDHYDVASYERICNELGLNSSSDFRFTHGANHGLGSIYFYVSGCAMKIENAYPGFDKFSDKGGKAIKGKLIYYIETDAVAQYDWFATNTASGLT